MLSFSLSLSPFWLSSAAQGWNLCLFIRMNVERKEEHREKSKKAFRTFLYFHFFYVCTCIFLYIFFALPWATCRQDTKVRRRDAGYHKKLMKKINIFLPLCLYSLLSVAINFNFFLPFQTNVRKRNFICFSTLFFS